jgi:FSR family fosmidomycin resistance protein-like MFS transporter
MKAVSAIRANDPGRRTIFSILFAISFVHLLNDTIQSVVPAIFPIIKESLLLTYTQLGLIALALNITASLLQPLIGLYSDTRPKPYLLPLGMVSTLLGVLALALAAHFWTILLSVVLIGIGSAVFHPESSRIAYLAAGNRRGLAQSIFQVGGNSGQALAPIMTALIFVPLGQFGIIWFCIAAGSAIILQTFTARWYTGQLKIHPPVPKRVKPAVSDSDKAAEKKETLDPARRKQVSFAIFILVLLVTTKMCYLSGMTSFYPFYLMEHRGLTIDKAQLYIFVFLVAGAIGTFMGGPLADYWGRRNVIWFSIIGALPFAFLLPYANLFWSAVLLFLIGVTIIASSSVVVVYAQELVPGKIGTVSGLFFGLSFGIGGLAAAALGALADWTSIGLVIRLCAFLPLLGLLTIFLPSDRKLREWTAQAESEAEPSPSGTK